MTTPSLHATETTVISPSILLVHWQGHRNLTRKVIEVYPEDKLFNYSIGGMRPFGELILEILTMAGPGIEGIATAIWPSYAEATNRYPIPCSKAQLLLWWDEATAKINELWPKISSERWHQNDKAFGMYEGPIYWSVYYFIDNEIHHRGQAYVYLRSLGIEPPAFWNRM
jgi:uncharacterized damage-inducible protein DinB